MLFLRSGAATPSLPILSRDMVWAIYTEEQAHYHHPRPSPSCSSQLCSFSDPASVLLTHTSLPCRNPGKVSGFSSPTHASSSPSLLPTHSSPSTVLPWPCLSSPPVCQPRRFPSPPLSLLPIHPSEARKVVILLGESERQGKGQRRTQWTT